MARRNHHRTHRQERPEAQRSQADESRPQLGRELGKLLDQSAPPEPSRQEIPSEPPPASAPLVGSSVLDVIGTGGVPRREMHDIIHAPDDQIVEHHLGPLQEPSVSFRPDPEVGDAGADLADELGQSYLEAATTGEDMSERENAADLATSELGGPFLEVDTEAGGDDALTEPVIQSVEIPSDHRGDPAPATQPSSGEVPRGLRRRKLKRRRASRAQRHQR